MPLRGAERRASNAEDQRFFQAVPSDVEAAAVL